MGSDRIKHSGSLPKYSAAVLQAKMKNIWVIILAICLSSAAVMTSPEVFGQALRDCTHITCIAGDPADTEIEVYGAACWNYCRIYQTLPNHECVTIQKHELNQGAPLPETDCKIAKILLIGHGMGGDKLCNLVQHCTKVHRVNQRGQLLGIHELGCSGAPVDDQERIKERLRGILGPNVTLTCQQANTQSSTVFDPLTGKADCTSQVTFRCVDGDVIAEYDNCANLKYCPTLGSKAKCMRGTKEVTMTCCASSTPPYAGEYKENC